MDQCLLGRPKLAQPTIAELQALSGKEQEVPGCGWLHAEARGTAPAERGEAWRGTSALRCLLLRCA